MGMENTSIHPPHHHRAPHHSFPSPTTMASPSPTEVSVPIYAAAPLPPGWTEHRAPTGQFYYYHAESGESTYVRPSIPVLATKEIDTNVVSTSSNKSGEGTEKNASTTSTTSTTTTTKKKKEKPKTKEAIPETVWMKVTTTAGNVFYTNVETKVSSWTIPEEIKEQVKLYEEAQARKAEELRLAEVEQARAKAEEAQRIHEAEQRRMIELEVQKVRAEVEAEAQLRGLKRKNDYTAEPGQPTVQTPANPSTGSEGDRLAKIAKVEQTAQPEEDDQDEDWQRQIAEEMAQEAAEQSGTSIPHQTTPTATTTVASNPPPATINQPPPTGLSLEELKATFKAMLLEKSIDPMAPWDNELPKFVTDARYLALPSMKERRDLFDEFCKEKIRQLRAAKSAVPKVDPPQAYRSLLIEFVTSTRTLWEDFKSKHKKDPRFRNFGRDDREREKAFKSWLKELGEQKRKLLLKAEDDFKKLLIEKGIPPKEGDEEEEKEEEYKDFKERVKNDPRFLAITSNSSKESMWKTWRTDQIRTRDLLKKDEGATNASTQNGKANPEEEEEDKKKKMEKQMASLKAREDHVNQIKKKIDKEAAVNRSLVDKDHFGINPETH
ncbi:hypothetical protein PGT21_009741 [Puccinia graminis f. sp. tritici]|uniref:Transcription elongation regulator 1 n=1 Tax=Puccinia graminis f. sp. tritici TaxID=56615 RepID=A0A5B0R1G1_PUCGR|nr:hypothetical protein PGT21_009741 [Puccinia graminis f. sp. tritici]